MAESNHNTDFLLSEYNSLREEIKWIISQVEALENFALILSGSFWAWLIVQPWKPIFFCGAWFPLLVASLFFIKRQALSASLKEVAIYVMKLEVHFSLPEGLGWEHHLISNNATHFRKWREYYWSVLLGVNFLFAILLSILNI